MTDHKYRCEAAIRELKAKVKGTEEVSCERERRGDIGVGRERERERERGRDRVQMIMVLLSWFLSGGRGAFAPPGSGLPPLGND